VREFGHEAGQHGGVDVAGVTDERLRELLGDLLQRGQRDTDTADGPGLAVGAGQQDQMRPHGVPQSLGAVALQQQSAQLVQGHAAGGQAGEQPAVDRDRIGSGDQPLERRAGGVQRHGIAPGC
jgi:hypothetical protein